MPRKLSLRKKELIYWSEILIAFSQVTFGVFWAAVFLPLENYKLSVVVLNLVATIVLVIIGRLIAREGDL